jgi:hypothetical protein
MAIAFSPTPEDVERYRHLRILGTELTQEVANTVASQVWKDIGKAIGILHRDQLETEHVRNVLADCCIYDSFENGKNVMQRFSETHPEQPGTDEHFVLDAYLRAEYRIVAPESALPGVGIHCRDLRTQEELFLMDLSFSRSTELSNMALAARLVPFGKYWITTGAALPVYRSKEMEATLQHIDQRGLWDPISFVRTYLAAGGAELIYHDDTGMKPRKRSRSVAPTVDPTDLCPCRSGLMYKYCCGRVKAAPASS